MDLLYKNIFPLIFPLKDYDYNQVALLAFHTNKKYLLIKIYPHRFSCTDGNMLKNGSHSLMRLLRDLNF